MRVTGSSIEIWRNDGIHVDTSRRRAGLDLRRGRLRRHRPSRDHRPPRRLRRADARRRPATAPSAPQSLQATRRRRARSSLTWSCARLERRLAAHHLHGLPLADLGWCHHHALDGALPVHELHGHDRRERHHLLLQGHRLQRGRRELALERGPGDADRVPRACPLLPLSLGATPGDHQVVLNWSAPGSNGGSPLTTYTVYRSLTSGGATTTLSTAPYLSTSFTDTTAANGTTYYYKVTASNAVGESSPSNEAPATPTAPASAPSAPLSLGATPGDHQVVLNWSAPGSNGGSPLTTYTVYRSLTSGGATTTLSTAPYLSTSFTDTTAANGTTYYYKVTASNAVGESSPSNEAPATPAAPASAPSLR